MKKTIAFLVIMLPLVSFAQQLHYGSGGTVYNSENKKVTPSEMRILLEKNSEALTFYNAGRNKKTWGNVLFYGGLGLIATNLIVASNTDNTTYSGSSNNPTIQSDKSSGTLAIIGGVLVAVSIPVKIGYPKKIKLAVEDYNKGLVNNYEPKQKLTIVASNQQLGLRFEF